MPKAELYGSELYYRDWVCQRQSFMVVNFIIEIGYAKGRALW